MSGEISDLARAKFDLESALIDISGVTAVVRALADSNPDDREDLRSALKYLANQMQDHEYQAYQAYSEIFGLDKFSEQEMAREVWCAAWKVRRDRVRDHQWRADAVPHHRHSHRRMRWLTAWSLMITAEWLSRLARRIVPVPPGGQP